MSWGVSVQGVSVQGVSDRGVSLNTMSDFFISLNTSLPLLPMWRTVSKNILHCKTFLWESTSESYIFCISPFLIDGWCSLKS